MKVCLEEPFPKRLETAPRAGVNMQLGINIPQVRIYRVDLRPNWSAISFVGLRPGKEGGKENLGGWVCAAGFRATSYIK